MTKKFLGVEVESKINIGDILTMLGIFGAVVVISFGVWRELYDRTANNGNRITIVEKEIIDLRREADRDRSEIKEDLGEIKEGIKEVRQTLSRKADK